jgi:hypothetical protein
MVTLAKLRKALAVFFFGQDMVARADYDSLEMRLAIAEVRALKAAQKIEEAAALLDE